MKTKPNWKPSKYNIIGGELRASKNHQEVAISSRLITEILASLYGEAIPNYAHGALLDLGCGNAPLYVIYKKYCQSVFWVDWEASLHESKYLDLTANLNEEFELERDAFDIVLCSDVIEHLHTPEIAISEAYKALKPGGRLLLNVPFFYWLHEEPHDYYRYTEYGLKHVIEKAGFEIEELHAYGGVIEVLSDIVSKLVVGIPYIGKYICITIQQINLQALRFKCYQAFSKRSSKKFPLGYFLVAKKE